jgi:hypothetical protein
MWTTNALLTCCNLLIGYGAREGEGEQRELNSGLFSNILRHTKGQVQLFGKSMGGADSEGLDSSHLKFLVQLPKIATRKWRPNYFHPRKDPFRQ